MQLMSANHIHPKTLGELSYEIHYDSNIYFIGLSKESMKAVK